MCLYYGQETLGFISKWLYFLCLSLGSPNITQQFSLCVKLIVCLHYFLVKQWPDGTLELMMILQPVGLDLEMLAPYIPMDDDFQLRTPESLCSSSSLGFELPTSNSTPTAPSVPAALAEPVGSNTSQQNTGTTEQDNSRWGLIFRETRSVLPINTSTNKRLLKKNHFSFSFPVLSPYLSLSP